MFFIKYLFFPALIYKDQIKFSNENHREGPASRLQADILSENTAIKTYFAYDEVNNAIGDDGELNK